jgi:hypothetical protein
VALKHDGGGGGDGDGDNAAVVPWITAWHPLRRRVVGGVGDGGGGGSDDWHFPASLAPLQRRTCAEVYNLVLDSKHIVLINGFECVTLGHGFKDAPTSAAVAAAEPVLTHTYYGTQRVVDDLRRLPGWAAGKVTVTGALRDAATGLVVGLTGE